MLEALHAAIIAGSWPEALQLALDAWRQHRAPALADLIDRIAARCTSLPVPDHGHQRWWIDAAQIYTPTAVATLVAQPLGPPMLDREFRNSLHLRHPGVPTIVGLGARYGFAILDRLAYVLGWPDDPRSARALAKWLTEGAILLSTQGDFQVAYDAIAARLIELGDPRVLPAVAAAIERPRGSGDHVREAQRTVAGRIVAQLTPRAVPPQLAAAIDACDVLVGPPAPPRDTGREELLWAEVARHPRDLAPRQVLADRLVAAGDPRGELIALQCAASPRGEARANGLVRRHWYEWLGDLALVLTRRGTDFENGMLETVRVGLQTTPPWVYDHIVGHRELATVRAVLPHWIVPAQLAGFVDRLPHLPDHLEIDAPEVVDHLRARRATWPIRSLDYGQAAISTPGRGQWPPLAATFDAIAATFPDLEELGISSPGLAVDELARELAGLPRRLPRLAKIAVTVVATVYGRYGGLDGIDQELDQRWAPLAGLPLVEVRRRTVRRSRVPRYIPRR